jgi:hypothetical protein
VCDLDEMLTRAARFYGPSIDFSLVTVQLSRVAIGRRPWTANNTIRLVAGAPLATLIHELAHVWQYQNGNLQLLRGFVEQLSYQLGRDPYDYGGAAGVRAAVTSEIALTNFSNEGQAQILEDYWSALNVPGATGYRHEPLTPGYVDDLQVLVVGAGIGTRPPAGASLIETAAGQIVNRTAGWLEPIVGRFVK